MPYLSSTAVAWSLQAALCVDSHLGGFVTACRYLGILSGNRSLQTFNDREGLKEVLAPLLSAKELAGRRYGTETPSEMEKEFHHERL